MTIPKLKTERTAFDEEMLQLIINFLEEIGIKVIAKKLANTTILPGLCIRANSILLDKKLF